MRALRVWRLGVGTKERLVAAPTQKAAAAAFGESTGIMRAYGSVTGNAESIALAMSQPGVVFSKPHGGPVELRVYKPEEKPHA